MHQKGIIPPILLILLAAAGIIIYLLVTSTFPFKDKLFSQLFSKPSSFAQQAESVPDEILIKFKPGVPEQARERILNSHALEKIDSIPEIEVDLTKVAPQAKDQIIEALNKNPQVEYAEPNFLGELLYEPNDPYWASSIAQWGLKKIGGAQAWDITRGNANFVVAVPDTGMMTTHEDLLGKAVKQYNAYDGTADVTDTNGHGTLVAGIVGALTDNGKGVASLGFLTPIMPIDITAPDGSINTFTTAKALTYAADNGATSINASWAYGGSSTSMKNAVDYVYNKGVVLAAAAGNSGCNCTIYPAGYSNVIAVGASDGSDQKASFSNYGSFLDVLAPGSGIYSTAASGGYGSFAGTSSAAPLVTALAALIRAVNPALTNQQVFDIITSTALDLSSPGWDETTGWGRIQADKALQKASGITPPPPDTTTPTTSITQPTDGSTVSGVLDITADATDNVGVTKVEFYIDGSLHASDVTSPYLSSWDTTLYSNGSHNLQAKAYDLAGNVGSSSLVTVTVDNPIPTPTPTSTPTPSDTTPPTVSITNPLDGSTIKAPGKVNIQTTASDNVSVSKVEFLVNNSVKCTDTFPPYSCQWSVPGKKNTAYTIQAKAYDTSGNANTSTITVTAR